MEKFGEKIRTIECDDCFNLNILNKVTFNNYDDTILPSFTTYLPLGGKKGIFDHLATSCPSSH